MKEKLTIQVRKYPADKTHHVCGSFEVVGEIRRVVWAEAIGNFNPIFCRYNGKRTLVHSDAGDLSDPFRRTQDYAESLFIETH